MNGGVEVLVEVRGGRSRVVGLAARPPLAARVVAGPSGSPELVLVGSAAGLLEGDTVSVDVTLRPHARLRVRTTAATLAHPCPGGGSTEATVTARLGRGAALAWLPEPLVAFAACRHRARTRVMLSAGAAAVWYEAVTLGRSGERAGAVDLRLDATLDGAPLLRDGLRAGGGTSAGSPAVLGGLRHAGSVHLLGRRPADKGPCVLELAGPGATARAVAPDAASLEHLLAPVRDRFLERLPDPSTSPEPKEASVHA